MVYKIIVITLLVFSVPITWAEEDSQAFQDLLYSCQDAKMRISSENSEKEDKVGNIGYTVEKVSSSSLILYQKEDYEGYQRVRRTGSKSLIRQCGDFTVIIRGGFLNTNPMGELGTIEFPVVSISFKGKSLVEEIGIGVCMMNNGVGRYNQMPCPENWASEIVGFKEGKLYLKHTYEKFETGGDHSEDSYKEYRFHP